MRILFTFVGGQGHFRPQLPVARAARAAGHPVAFAGQPSICPVVVAEGFTAIPAGANIGDTGERFPLLPIDDEREERGLREGFALRIARDRTSALLTVAAEWRPDLIVHDEVDFGAAIAADKLGLPHVPVVVIAAGSFIRPELVAEPLDEVRAEHGLPADPELAALRRHLVVSPVPASYRNPGDPLPTNTCLVRPWTPAPAPERASADLPTVYFTLGTIFNTESGDLFQRVLAGLRDLPVNLVVTVGRDIDPAGFGPLPGTVRIERFIPQAAILPRCDVVVSHGGSGSVIGALAHGVPMVLIPMGADQPLNGRRCAELGVGLMLDPIAVTARDVAAAVSTVLTDRSYRSAADCLRDEIAAMPDPESVLPHWERLVLRTG